MSTISEVDSINEGQVTVKIARYSQAKRSQLKPNQSYLVQHFDNYHRFSLNGLRKLEKPVLMCRTRKMKCFYYWIVTVLATFTFFLGLSATQSGKFGFHIFTSSDENKQDSHPLDFMQLQRLFSRWFCHCPAFNVSVLQNVHSNLSCIKKSSALMPTVMCEVAQQFNYLSQVCTNSYLPLDWSCKPTLITFTCDQLSDSSLPCSKPFVIEQFDYHTQFHCLYRIAQSLQPHKHNQTSKVSRLHHQVWFYEPSTTLEFHVYLGLASHLRFYQPEAVFIWNSGNLPIGKWWQEVISLFNQNDPVVSVSETFSTDTPTMFVNRKVFTSRAKVYSVVRRLPSTIYSNEIEKVQHKSDITRMESAMLFGGFYADTDTLSLKPLDPLLQYPLTMGRERHNGVGNMMIFAQPMAAYLLLWHASYFDLKKDEWVEHSIDGNHRLAALCPDLIHLEQSSLLTPNYDNRHLFYSENLTLSDSYMVHTYWRHIETSAYRNPLGVAFAKTLVGRLYRAIYYGLSSTSG